MKFGFGDVNVLSIELHFVPLVPKLEWRSYTSTPLFVFVMFCLISTGLAYWPEHAHLTEAETFRRVVSTLRSATQSSEPT
jgi:hypothetical protein